MRLLDLEPQFVIVLEPGRMCRYVDELALAQGVQFLCPKCFEANGGEVGTHAIRCWFRDRGVLPSELPGPARWSVSGTGYADLTLSPSVFLTSGCAWHGCVENGAVSTC
jgi:hypothetical protein